MSDIERVCAECGRLRVAKMLSGYLPLCGGLVGWPVVPHRYSSGRFTFWRIPLSCPRDDVEKSETRVPAMEWIDVGVEEYGDLIDISVVGLKDLEEMTEGVIDD